MKHQPLNPSKRLFKGKALPYLLGLTTIIILFLMLIGSTKKEVVQKPNIIFIMADDMGYSDIGCYGGEVKTPNIDQLAANGIKLRNFYNNARCCPTRASLLTGQYPHTVGMGHMVTAEKAKIQPGPYQGFLDDKSKAALSRLASFNIRLK